jgi:hypothetical protein
MLQLEICACSSAVGSHSPADFLLAAMLSSSSFDHKDPGARRLDVVVPAITQSSKMMSYYFWVQAGSRHPCASVDSVQVEHLKSTLVLA